MTRYTLQLGRYRTYNGPPSLACRSFRAYLREQLRLRRLQRDCVTLPHTTSCAPAVLEHCAHLPLAGASAHLPYLRLNGRGGLVHFPAAFPCRPARRLPGLTLPTYHTFPLSTVHLW